MKTSIPPLIFIISYIKNLIFKNIIKIHNMACLKLTSQMLFKFSFTLYVGHIDHTICKSWNSTITF